MAFDFPAAPTEGQTFRPAGGPTYVYYAPVWQALAPSPPIAYVATAERRNRLVNGAMIVSQENNPDTSIGVNGFPFDMWQVGWATSGTPAGIGRTVDGDNYLRINSQPTVDASVAAADIVFAYAKIEGKDVKDLQWGTANAKPVVLRFTARCQTVSSLVIGVAVKNAAITRAFVKNITLTSQWQDFVIPVPGCTDGVWETDIVAGMMIAFCGMAGTTYNAGVDGAWSVGNNYATPAVGNIMAVGSSCMDIGKVGLYADPNNTGVAPPWEYPDYASELAKCKRYWYTASLAQVFGNVNLSTSYLIQKPVQATPRYGGAMTGVNTGIQSGFAATVGTLMMVDENTMQETRTCSAATTFGRYGTNVTINARM